MAAQNNHFDFLSSIKRVFMLSMFLTTFFHFGFGSLSNYLESFSKSSSEMASKSIFITLALLLVLCLMLMKEASGCNVNGHGCLHADAAVSMEIRNRKVMFAGLKEKKGSELQNSASYENGGKNLMGWELRKVPSGPDPLHHNGKSPKKPRTP